MKCRREQRLIRDTQKTWVGNDQRPQSLAFRRDFRTHLERFRAERKVFRLKPGRQRVRSGCC